MSKTHRPSSSVDQHQDNVSGTEEENANPNKQLFKYIKALLIITCVAIGVGLVVGAVHVKDKNTQTAMIFGAIALELVMCALFVGRCGDTRVKEDLDDEEDEFDEEDRDIYSNSSRRTQIHSDSSFKPTNSPKTQQKQTRNAEREPKQGKKRKH